MPSIAEAYRAGDRAVTACLGGPAQAIWTRKLPEYSWAPGVAGAVIAYNARLGITRAIRGDEPVIVTGQQPGIFTGPLYTIYKAITCIGLARQLSEQHGRTILPVFWVGSEDHDFDEASVVHALTKNHRAQELRYTPEANVDALPMHAVPIEPQLHELVETLAHIVPGSEFTDEITTLLHDTLDAADSLADWCARLLARLFRDTPLVLFAPHLPEARAASREVIRQAIEHPLETTRLVNAGGQLLERCGYAAQVVKAPEECAFFLLWEGRRRKVVFQDEHFALPEEDVQLSGDELRTLLEDAPERFSPNVALRCIVQQALFPTMAYVAGPGETAYWAQLKALFAWYGQPMPVVYPRTHARISTIKVNRLRKELGVDDGLLQEDPARVVAHTLRAVQKSPAIEVIDQYREFMAAAAKSLSEDLQTTARPETRQSAEKLDAYLAHLLEKLARREARADERHVAAVRERVLRVCNTLAPDRKPQERVYTVFSFLFQQGPELIPRLLDSLDIRDFAMQEIEL